MQNSVSPLKICPKNMNLTQILAKIWATPPGFSNLCTMAWIKYRDFFADSWFYFPETVQYKPLVFLILNNASGEVMTANGAGKPVTMATQISGGDPTQKWLNFSICLSVFFDILSIFLIIF